MTPEEVKVTSSKTRYPPHHAELKPNKLGEVCIVFDALAKFDSVSLNDKYLTSSNLLSNDPDNNNSTGAIVGTKLLIGLNCKIY